MRSPTPRRAGKALPAIYVVVDGNGRLLSAAPHRTMSSARAWLSRLELPGDRIVEYVPRKAGSRRAR